VLGVLGREQPLLMVRVGACSRYLILVKSNEHDALTKTFICLVDSRYLLLLGLRRRNGRRDEEEDRSAFAGWAICLSLRGASDSEKQTYELVDKRSGKVLMSVAESDPDLGPSARFNMEVLWRPDSKAFALTAMLWGGEAMSKSTCETALLFVTSSCRNC
jgi:hypothetical protein